MTALSWFKLSALLAFMSVCIEADIVLVDLHRKAAGIDLAPLVKQSLLDLEESHNVVLEAGLTAREARLASAEERAALPKITANVQAVLTSTTAAVDALKVTTQQLGATATAITTQSAPLLVASTKTIEGLQPVEQKATTAIAQLQVDIAHLDVILSDSNIPKTTANFASMSESGAKILQDGADETHKLVHPDKVKLGFWGTIDGGLLWAHSHVIPPLF